MNRLFLIPLILLVAACSSNFTPRPAESNPMLDLAGAKSKWAAVKTGVGMYKLNLGYSGMTGYLKVMSDVDGTGMVMSCVEAYRDWSAQSSTYTACPMEKGTNVESLFEKIEAAIVAGREAHVEYDATFGVPTFIFLQATGGEMADAGMGSSVAIEFDFQTP